MSEQQIPQVSKMMGELVAHQSGFNALPKSVRQFVIQEPKAAIKVMVAALRNRPKELAPLREYKVLRPVALKTVEARPFKADDTFFNRRSDVKMMEHGGRFIHWFTGEVEEDAPEGMLIPLTLIKNANDSEIIADLGGEEKAEVTLAEIWRLMVAQANGGEGALLNNGWANIFYVRDCEGVLRAVYVDWRGDGWRAGAFALSGGGWSVDGQVFSRSPR